MSTDLIKKAEISKELGEVAQLFPDFVNDVIDKEVERKFWESNNAKTTPSDVLLKREGSKDRNGNPVTLEYFNEGYTLSELDKRFPGWSMDEMKIEYIRELRIFVVSGYLFISYPTPSGIKTVKRYAVGSSIVHIKKESIIDGMPEPSQPDDSAKAALTEWIKIAGKRVGIGIDIYTQEITPALEQEFYSLIDGYPERHIKNFEAIWGTIEKGMGARKYIKSLPPPDIKARVLQMIEDLKKAPEDYVDGILGTIFSANFASKENYKAIDLYMAKIEAVIAERKEQAKNNPNNP